MIAHLRSLLKEAPPAPWKGDPGGIREILIRDADGKGVVIAPRSVADVIAASRNHLEALLDVAEAAQEMLAQYPGRDHLGRDTELRFYLSRLDTDSSSGRAA